jgi:hypothetical protein
MGSGYIHDSPCRQKGLNRDGMILEQQNCIQSEGLYYIPLNFYTPAIFQSVIRLLRLGYDINSGCATEALLSG